MKHIDDYGGLHTVKTHKKGGSLPGVIRDADYTYAAFRLAVDAYLSYRECAEALYGTAELFDESHEDLDSLSWLNPANESESSDSLIEAGHEVLEDAQAILSCIASRAERQCKRALSNVLSSPAKHQVKIFGRSYHISKPDIELLIASYFDALCDFEFSYDADENYARFLSGVISELDEYRS